MLDSQEDESFTSESSRDNRLCAEGCLMGSGRKENKTTQTAEITEHPHLTHTGYNRFNPYLTEQTDSEHIVKKRGTHSAGEICTIK